MKDKVEYEQTRQTDPFVLRIKGGGIKDFSVRERLIFEFLDGYIHCNIEY